MKEKSGQAEKEAQESSGLKTAGPEGEITAGLCANCMCIFTRS
jgi:dynamin GTPase